MIDEPRAETETAERRTRLLLRWSSALYGDGLGAAGKTRLGARWVAVPEVSTLEAPVIPLREGTRPVAIGGGRGDAFPTARPASAAGSAR